MLSFSLIKMRFKRFLALFVVVSFVCLNMTTSGFTSALCTNDPPTVSTNAYEYSCFQQAIIFKQCEQPFMVGKCDYSCGRCDDYNLPPLPTCTAPYSPSAQAIRDSQTRLNAANNRILNWFSSRVIAPSAAFATATVDKKMSKIHRVERSLIQLQRSTSGYMQSYNETDIRSSLDEAIALPHDENPNAQSSSSFETERAAPSQLIRRSGNTLINSATGAPFFFGGTNAYYAAINGLMTPQELAFMFSQQASKGVTVMRVFAFDFFNSFGIWPSLGAATPNQAALVQLDRVMAAAARYKMKVILVFSNYESFLGGVEEWVAQKYGPPQIDAPSTRYPRELFYTDVDLRCQFRAYMKFLVQRTNTINGRLYRTDPAILSFELQNEPKTTDNFEKIIGLRPGSIVCNWVNEQSSYLSQVLKVTQLISVGDEGYMYNPSYTGPFAFLNNGSKGSDFKCNLQQPSVSMGTLHLYPGLWGMSANPAAGSNSFTSLGEFINCRKKVANSLNKPLIIEEYGVQSGYTPNRDGIFSYINRQANLLNLNGSLVWAVSTCDGQPGQTCPQYGASNEGGFVFAWRSEYSGNSDTRGSTAVAQQNSAMNTKTDCYQKCWAKSMKKKNKKKKRKKCVKKQKCDGAGVPQLSITYVPPTAGLFGEVEVVSTLVVPRTGTATSAGLVFGELGLGEQQPPVESRPMCEEEEDEKKKKEEKKEEDIEKNLKVPCKICNVVCRREKRGGGYLKHVCTRACSRCKEE